MSLIMIVVVASLLLHHAHGAGRAVRTNSGSLHRPRTGPTSPVDSATTDSPDRFFDCRSSPEWFGGGLVSPHDRIWRWLDESVAVCGHPHPTVCHGFHRCPSCREVATPSSSADGRVRCLCGAEFCASCRRMPYHDGVDCAAYESACRSRCRYCRSVVPGSALRSVIRHISNRMAPAICNSEPCTRKAAQACSKILPCSHPCLGTKDQTSCLPCLYCPDPDGFIRADEICKICSQDALSTSPCIQVGCGHIFHYDCVLQRLFTGLNRSTRITFDFLSCPSCSETIETPTLNTVLKNHKKFQRSNFLNKQKEFQRKVAILVQENLRLEYLYGRLTVRERRFYHDFTLEIFSVYRCSRCNEPFRGVRSHGGGEFRSHGGGESSSLRTRPDEMLNELCISCLRQQQLESEILLRSKQFRNSPKYLT